MPCRDIYFVITGTEGRPEDQKHYLMAVGRKTSEKLVADNENPCLAHGCLNFYQNSIMGMPMPSRKPGPQSLAINEDDGFEILDPVQAFDRLKKDEKDNPHVEGFANMLAAYYYANTGIKLD